MNVGFVYGHFQKASCAIFQLLGLIHSFACIKLKNACDQAKRF